MKKYNTEFKSMIVELYKTGISDKRRHEYAGQDFGGALQAQGEIVSHSH